MGNKYRQPPSDLVRSTLDIEDRVSTLETSPRAVATAVDSGNWKFIADNGIVLANFGDQGPGLGRGWLFRRGNGAPALGVGGNPTGRQFWRLTDNNNVDIITDDSFSGSGIARPYIPIAFTNLSTFGAGAHTTTSTTFDSAYSLYGYKQQPQLEIEYFINVPSGVTAEVVITRTDAIPVVVVGPNVHVGPVSAITFIQGAIDGDHLSHLNHDIQMRVASGTGTIGMTVVAAYGKQSP
jgi:hypothetical protein